MIPLIICTYIEDSIAKC